MKSKQTLSLIIVAIILVGIFLFSHEQGNAQKPTSNVITVAATHVTEKNVIVKTQAIGTVQPIESVSLKSLVDGQILSVNFKEGDMVKKGELLVTIDPRPYQVQLETAQANLAKDQAQLINARSQLARGKKLIPNGFISKQDFDTLRANVRSLNATVQADQAAVTNAKLQLSYTTIYSPITGKTGNLLIKPGNLVKANDTNPLVIINQINPIYVTFSLPQQQLAIIRKELSKGPINVTAILDQQGKYSSQGILTFIDNSVDSTTGTIQMKATFVNNDKQLWPGEFVNIKLPMNKIENALVLPTLAVQAGPNGNYVFVIGSDNKVNLRTIEIGPNIGNHIVIKKGLNVGEQVVTAGQLRLTENVQVQIAGASKKNLKQILNNHIAENIKSPQAKLSAAANLSRASNNP